MLPLIFIFLLHAAAASSASVNPERLDIVGTATTAVVVAAAAEKAAAETPAAHPSVLSSHAPDKGKRARSNVELGGEMSSEICAALYPQYRVRRYCCGLRPTFNVSTQHAPTDPAVGWRVRRDFRIPGFRLLRRVGGLLKRGIQISN